MTAALALLVAILSVALVGLYRQWSRTEAARDYCATLMSRYQFAVNDLDRWCGHASPHARLIAAHIAAIGEGRGLNAGTPIGAEPCTIVGLREQLRRLDVDIAANPPASEGAQHG